MTTSSLTKLTSLEEMCRKYSSPVGMTEQEYCERAERMIKSAIEAGSFPSEIKNNIKVFAQGSYRNGTNIPVQSDVDVSVCLTEPFFADYSLADGLAASHFGNIDHAYSFDRFRNDVASAIIQKFGISDVSIGNKSIKIKGNSGRVGADAVPSFEYRKYFRDGAPLIGTKLISRDARAVINWPAWHYDNGVEKNKLTGMRFKKVVRVLKSLRLHMSGDLQKTPSFLIESLVWNVPNNQFGTDLLVIDCLQCLSWLLSVLMNTQTAVGAMWEVNSLKMLFSPEQAWTIQTATAFIAAAIRELET